MLNAKLKHALTDFPTFCDTFFYVKSKKGVLQKFVRNRAQRHLHNELEAQKEDIGLVRAIVLKGRQQGCSTYTQARFLYKVIMSFGVSAFILTHQADATKNIFSITKTFFDKLPHGLAPKCDTFSSKEMRFNSLNSGYAVGTAGSTGVGRSRTIQLLHASEAAYYKNAEEHAQGILQAVPAERNTEIIIESTANGLGNYFHNLWLTASDPKSIYKPVFLPWYWQDEYRIKPTIDDDLSLSDVEEEYYNLYHKEGLEVEHLLWRRQKLLEFSRDYITANERFCVEYPMNALDAFRASGEDRFIKPHLVMQARSNTVDSKAPLVIGVDPALGDNDRLAIIRRRGRLCYNLETYKNHSSMQIVGLVREIIRKENPAKVCIDCIGIGDGIVDRLKELGYGDIIEAVNVARKALNQEQFANRRAELWHEMREWLACEQGVQVPDRDDLQADLTGLSYKHKSNGQLILESKEDLKKRGIDSPDTADALALTFAVGDFLHTNVSHVNRLPENTAGMFL